MKTVFQKIKFVMALIQEFEELRVLILIDNAINDIKTGCFF